MNWVQISAQMSAQVTCLYY